MSGNARGLDAADRAFLPSALEILETPPSPVRVAGLWLIVLGGVVAIAFAWFGRIDIHAVAPGRIQPSGRSKIVQPLEAGKVVAIRIENGAAVEQGAVLVELDPTETGADREGQTRELESVRAEITRRRAAIASAAAGDPGAAAPVAFDAGTSAVVRAREQAVLTADLAQLRAGLMNLDAQRDERLAARNRLVASIAARDKLLKLTQERVDMRETVNGKGSLSRAMVIDSLQTHEAQMIAQVTERGQLVETETALRTLGAKREELLVQFIADQTVKLADAERRGDRLAQELVKASSRNERTILRAPIAGTVQQLAVTTLGQVVTTGQALLTVVPADAPIEIEAYIRNQDIGFVESGQRAVVKVEAFPFTRYGTLEAEVVKVSREGVDEREAVALADPAGSALRQPGPQSGRTQSFVFQATLRLFRRTVAVDGREVPLVPGMAVAVEVLTGSRQVVDYVLSPLREVTARAAHER